MKTVISKSLLASLALFTISATSADAAVVVTLPTAVTAGSLVFTNDISFTITTAGAVQLVVFDEWVANDENGSEIPGSSITPGSLSYSINGGATLGLELNSFYDNFDFIAGAVTHNDGYLFLETGLSVAVSDVFTLKAANYTLAAGSLPADFNPLANQTFTGNAFLTASNGNRLSANTSVIPEPSHTLLLVGGLAMALRRRRA